MNLFPPNGTRAVTRAEVRCFQAPVVKAVGSVGVVYRVT